VVFISRISFVFFVGATRLPRSGIALDPSCAQACAGQRRSDNVEDGVDVELALRVGSVGIGGFLLLAFQLGDRDELPSLLSPTSSFPTPPGRGGAAPADDAGRGRRLISSTP
jgi:hypothetical protein